MCLARPFSTQNTNTASLSVKSYPGKSGCGRREPKYVQILSQCTQGFNADKKRRNNSSINATEKYICIYHTSNMETWQRDLRKIRLLYNLAWIGLETQKRATSLSFSALMQFELGSKQDLVYCTLVIAYLLSSVKWRTSMVN